MAKRNWFQLIPKAKPTGWKKTDPPSVRRRKMLKAKHGNALRAARLSGPREHYPRSGDKGTSSGGCAVLLCAPQKRRRRK